MTKQKWSKADTELGLGLLLLFGMIMVSLLFLNWVKS